MTSIVRWGWNLAYEKRQWLFAASTSFLVPLILQQTWGRDKITLAHLAQQGKLKEDFREWIVCTYGEDKVNSAERDPDAYLTATHFFSDFSLKIVLPVVVVASTYFAPLEKISRIDLPMIACAPLVAKAVHLFFIYWNKSVLVTNAIGALCRGIDAASWTLFALYNLATSTTVYRTAALAACILVSNKLTPLQYLVSPDPFRTPLFTTGVSQAIYALLHPTGSYDIQKLMALYKDPDHKQIDAAFKADQISPTLAHALEQRSIEVLLQRPLCEMAPEIENMWFTYTQQNDTAKLDVLKNALRRMYEKKKENFSIVAKQNNADADTLFEEFLYNKTQELSPIFSADGIFAKLAKTPEDVLLMFEFDYYIFVAHMKRFLQDPRLDFEVLLAQQADKLFRHIPPEKLSIKNRLPVLPPDFKFTNYALQKYVYCLQKKDVLQ